MDPNYEDLMRELQKLRAAPDDPVAPDPSPHVYDTMRVDAGAGADFEHGTPEDRLVLRGDMSPEQDPNAAMKAAFRKMAGQERAPRRGTTAAPMPDIDALMKDLLATSGGK